MESQIFLCHAVLAAPCFMWQLRLPCVVRAITEKGIEVEPWRKLRCASTTFSSLLVEDLGSTEIPNDVNMPERVQGPITGSVAPITMFYFPRYDPIGTVYDVMARFTSDLRTSMHLAASSAKIWDTGVPKLWPLTSSEHDSGRPGQGRASGATVSAQCSNRSPSKQGLSFRIQNGISMDDIDPLFGAISLAVLSESHQWFASCDSDRFVEEKYFESPRVKWWRCTLDSQLAQKEQHLAPVEFCKFLRGILSSKVALDARMKTIERWVKRIARKGVVHKHVIKRVRSSQVHPLHPQYFGRTSLQNTWIYMTYTWHIMTYPQKLDCCPRESIEQGIFGSSRVAQVPGMEGWSLGTQQLNGKWMKYEKSLGISSFSHFSQWLFIWNEYDHMQRCNISEYIHVHLIDDFQLKQCGCLIAMLEFLESKPMTILVSRARHTPETSCGRQSPKSVDPKVRELAESDGDDSKKLTWVSCIPNIRDVYTKTDQYVFFFGWDTKSNGEKRCLYKFENFWV